MRIYAKIIILSLSLSIIPLVLVAGIFLYNTQKELKGEMGEGEGKGLEMLAGADNLFGKPESRKKYDIKIMKLTDIKDKLNNCIQDKPKVKCDKFISTFNEFNNGLL